MPAWPHSPTLNTRGGRTFRRLLTAIATLGAIAAMVAAILFWRRYEIPTYRLVGDYPVANITLLPAENGFLVRESQTVFVMRDWQGHDHWRVTTAAPRWNAAPTRDRSHRGRGIRFSLSPNGRYFAAAIVNGTNTRVQVWRDGKAIGDIDLLTDNLPTGWRSVAALDSGRVIAWLDTGDHAQAYAIEANRIIARGLFPNRCLLATDGRSCVIAQRERQFLGAELLIRSGRISLTHPYTGTDPLTFFQGPGWIVDVAQGVDGTVLAANGAVYRHGTRVNGDTSWRHETMTPNGRYTLEHRGQTSRVFSPVTGDAWSFNVPDENLGGDATGNGRFALAYCQARLPKTLRDGLENMPGVSAADIDLSPQYLALYERPGIRRTVLRLEQLPFRVDLQHENQRWWFPSPDGQAVVFTIETPARSQCLLFRR